MKRVVIISGGTVNHIATHLALSAPAYGSTGRQLQHLCEKRWNPVQYVEHYDDTPAGRQERGAGLYEQPEPERRETARVDLRATRMAGGSTLETNADVDELVDALVADLNVKVIFMPVALCDFDPVNVAHFNVPEGSWARQMGKSRIGKAAQRLRTSDGEHIVQLKPAAKIISKIRQKRKDIFLVGFKTTDGVSEQEQYLAGLNLLKSSSCNLVLANDVKTRLNMIITPEEAKYCVTTNRLAVLKELVEMSWLRSHLTFTRSTVVAGEPVPWDSPLVPSALRTVVDHCIARGAYKPFRGATVGHFACKLGPTTFLTSRRKTNFNDLPTLGLVRIETDGPDTVLAYGSKPSVGGQSQRIIFNEHPEYDCIVHFHCPMRDDREIPPGQYGPFNPDWDPDLRVVSQREYECGSHQCGENTSRGLKRFGNLSCVMLDQHGPNIVFHHSIDPAEVIAFIEANFDLASKTGGPV